MDENFIQQIHASGHRFVLAVTGGGAGAVAALLRVPGGSQSVIECVVPYSPAALRAWIGGEPDQFCSEATARAMAMAALERAQRLDSNREGFDPYKLVGVGCTASLASDRPKKGEHRFHVAWQSVQRTVACSLGLKKGSRTRAEEDDVCTALVVTAMAEAAGLADSEYR